MLKRVDLGSPGRDDSGHRCRKFKELLREHLRGIAGLSLLKVLDEQTRERRVEAVYAEGDKLAEAEALHARELAGGIWETVGCSDTRSLVR